MLAAASALHRMVSAKRVAIERREPLEAGAAARGNVGGRVVGTEELRLVVFVERHQRRQPARHARMAGERGVLGVRQLQPPAQRHQRGRERRARPFHRAPVSSWPTPSNRGVPGGVDSAMTVRSELLRVLQQEDINFLLTNRIPRRLVTQFIGWFSRIEQPLVRDLSIGMWRLFSDLDLREAKKASFRSLHDCFIRELKDGARPIDRRAGRPGEPVRRDRRRLRRDRRHPALSRPRDFRTRSANSCPSATSWKRYRNGRYVTLRLTSSMYHRFHAPHDCRVERVAYMSGDTWNVNPIALRRVERLFCKNERAVAAHPARGWRPSGDAGAGRRDPGRQHPPAFSRRAAEPAPSRPQRHRLRCELPQGRGAGLVRARLDDHRVRARQVSRCATMSAKALRFASASR